MNLKQLKKDLKGTGVVPAKKTIENFILSILGKELTPKNREYMQRPFGMTPEQLKAKQEHAKKTNGLM